MISSFRSAVLCGAALTLGCCWPIPNVCAVVLQSETTRPFEVLTVRHRSATDAARLLGELLEAPDELRIVPDDARGELLVSGPPELLRTVRESLARIDAAVQQPAEARPEIRMYRAAPRQLDSLAAELRTWPEGVKASVSPREGILLVSASPDVHERIAPWIAERTDPRAPNASRPTNDRPAQRDDRSIASDERSDLTRLLAGSPTNSPRPLAANPAPNSIPADVERIRTWLPATTGGPTEQLNELSRLFGTRLRLDPDDATRSRLILRDGESIELRREGNEALLASGPANAVEQLALLLSTLDERRQPRGNARAHVLLLQREAQERVRSLVPDPVRDNDRGRLDRRGANPVRPASFRQDLPAPGLPQEEPVDGLPLDRFEGVQIDSLPDLDVIILRGRDDEIEQLSEIIRELERIGRETQAAIDIVELRFVDDERMAELIEEVREDLVGGRAGRATLIPLETPNALMLIGWGDAVSALRELIERLDQPTDPAAQFEVFPLRHATAEQVDETLQEFFGDRNGLGPQITSSIDDRTNSIVVHAAGRDLEQVRALIARLDVPRGERTRRARIFELRHSLAADVAETLGDAIAAAAPAGGGASLELLTVDDAGKELLRSGILEDVEITADERQNTLIVTGPIETFELIEALIRQLDSPGMTVKIKIFPVVNGDASSMVETLRALIPSQTGNDTGPRLSSEPGETSLAPLRFTVDVRSNSVIATGSDGDLRIVEALIVRLDEGDAMQRKTAVYQLKNAPAVDVALSINEFLRNRRQVESAAPGQANPFQQLEKEVVVVPEPVANKLILSATPRYFEEIEQLIEKLDEQPPQVMIQVLIAEVTLGEADEFGVELGIQDSVLFDRSLLGDLVTTNQTTQVSTPAGVTTTNSQVIQAATNVPGFGFNSSEPLGNSGSQQSLGSANIIGGQGISNFSVGRSSSELGFGGLVLSASSQNVSVLIRALQESRRLEVLSRPQVRTLDNQPAFIQIGQRVPRIAESTTNQNGQSNQVVLENVGLIMAVTPRIGPDGTVVMEIDAEKSALGPELEGIPVSVSNQGTVIRAPRIDTTTAQATVSAADGETIILGGLITKSTQDIHRKVPILGDIPIIDRLFRFDSLIQKRTELLIILTPRVIRSQSDEERLKQTELARMSWCAADVYDLHGDLQYVLPPDLMYDHPEEADVVYPAVDPRGNSSRRRAMEQPGSGPTVLPEPLGYPGSTNEPGFPPMVDPRDGRALSMGNPFGARDSRQPIGSPPGMPSYPVGQAGAEMPWPIAPNPNGPNPNGPVGNDPRGMPIFDPNLGPAGYRSEFEGPGLPQADRIPTDINGPYRGW
ncbi:MAG TPA: secretin N-terminal domain-containing protein [Pirellulaceae bacterium]|nr:secretin N-terminal domain-containing protein [Pirellulaceae bacterium]